MYPMGTYFCLWFIGVLYFSFSSAVFSVVVGMCNCVQLVFCWCHSFQAMGMAELICELSFALVFSEALITFLVLVLVQ